MSQVRVVVYCRISRDRTGANVGVDRQRNECEEFAERMGWTVVAVLVDNDISAYSGKVRKQYRTLLTMIGKGEVDVVLCWHTDRLHRSPVELEEYIDTCNPKNVSTHSTQAGVLDLSTPSGRMVARQLGAVARYESELRSARVKSAKQALAAGGKFAGGRRPFGWEVDGITSVPREAEAIEIASKDVLRGTSITEIARRWNADELPTITGKRWVGQTVRGILLRPRNAGLRTHRGQIVGPAEWKHIVEPETWHALRRHLEDPERRTQRGTEPRHLGTKRYRCGSLLPEGGECGETLRVGNYGNERQKAYRCSAPARDGVVQHVSINQDALDEYVVRKLINGAIEQGATTADDTRSIEPTSDADELEAAQAALAEELAAGRLPVAAWQAANAQLAQRLSELQIRAADAAGADVVSRAQGDFELDPWGTWEKWDLGQRREFMDNHVMVTVLPAHSRKPADLVMEKRVRLDWKWETGE